MPNLRRRALALLSSIAAMTLSAAFPAIAAPKAFEVSPEQTDQLPRGKEADGIIGDFVLRNDKVEAVISGNLPLRRANMSTFYGASGITPGCLYDLTLKGANNDQIVIFAPSSQQGMVSWVRVVKDGTDGEAVIETVVTGASNEGLYKRHEYVLKDGWQGVLISTTIRNEGKKARTFSTQDRWTNFSRTGRGGIMVWADAVDPADKAGYAYGSIQGSSENPDSLDLQPGQTVSFSRFVAVGSSPAEAVGVLHSLRGPVGTITGTLKDKDGKLVTTAQVAVRPRGAAANAAIPAYPDNQGLFSIRVPDGEYQVDISDLGRESVTRAITVANDQERAVDVAMTGQAGVAFNIRDEAGKLIPCKVQFHGVDGTKNPNLGPQNRAHGCVDQYHSETGQFAVALPPGKYRIVVTRGIEHSLIEQMVTVEPEKTVKVEGTLKRLVDTTGWVSADYHNHSTPSGDNVTGTDDRLINYAAEHIEFAPTTEHNRFYDWRPHIEKLKLTEFIQTVPGIELTGGGLHQNSFPFKPEPYTQDNGAPVWHVDPRITAITLRDWQAADPDRWIQGNHPDMVKNFIDRNGDGAFDGGFQGLAQLLDGIETQNNSPSAILDGVPYIVRAGRLGRDEVIYAREFLWLQMLNRGHRYAAMAVCDAHSIYGNGVGGWRMYMPSGTDEPAKIDWRENVRHAKAGRSILTTGPFMTVESADGAVPGGSIRATGPVTLKVKVQCTDWIDIDRVQVLVNGRQEPSLNFTRKSHPQFFGDGVAKFDQAIEVPLKSDAHLIVVAVGENHTLAAGYGTSTHSRLKPIAYHNPIFVDVDNNGFVPNYDTLGWPLPSKMISVEEAKKLLAR